MTWLPTLAPWQWWLLGLVPLAIILLYFLKLKRESLLVPSTFLWARTVEDLHVNSLIQWLRSHLLLLLQLLAVLLAALALLRPGVRDTESTVARKIYVIDTSASMQATDVEGAANRFELAKQKIRESLQSLGDQQQAMLIAFSDRADVVQSFSSDRRRLLEALDGLRVTSRSTNIHEALQAATGLLQSDRVTGDGNESAASDPAGNRPAAAEMLIYSDGKFPSANDLDMSPFQTTFWSVGSQQPKNLSILAFAVQRNADRPDELQAYATIANTGSVAATSPVSLKRDGVLIDADQVSLEPGAESGVSFTLAGDEAQRLELTSDEEDEFLLDNFAYSGIAPQQLVSVLLITPGNRPLELALSTGQAASLGNVEVFPVSYLDQPTYRSRAASGDLDLIIYDRCAPAESPRCNAFYVGSLPPANLPRGDGHSWQHGEPETSPLIIDVDRTHPLMRYLELFSILIAEARPLQPPPGATVLLSSATGPLLAVAPRDGFQDLVLGFEILSDGEGGTSLNTDWQIQRSWPVFVFNVMRFLTGASEGMTLSSVAPGNVATVRLGHTPDAGQTLRVTAPGGSASDLSIASLGASGSGLAAYSQTDEIGFYEVNSSAGQVLDRFTVNLFDLRESSIASAEQLTLGYQTVETTALTLDTRREYWRWLLVGMLGITTLEWWIYSRRLG